ncbi:MAG: glycogen-binding domain-containing protein [Vicinamibacterales bacterium]
MIRPTVVMTLVLTAVIGVLSSTEARSQGLSVDVSAGSVVYDPVSANVGTTNVMGTVRFDARQGGWVYGTAASPMRSGDPVWGSFGAGGRFLPSGSADRRTNIGLDVGAHGFLFRDAVVDQTGRGAAIDAIPLVNVSSGAASLELRGGWRGHTLAFAGATEHRGVWETGARASYDATVRLQADARWVRASEGTYPFLSGMLVHGGTPVQTWMQVGKWLSDDLNDVEWGAGVGVALGSQSTLWGSVRQEAPDPLYWNVARRSWSVGFTRRLGRSIAVAPLPVSRPEPGGVLIQLPASDAPGAQLSIAGDFNNWRPVPMQREDGQWVIRLPLAPGVYHYAFRAGDGDWFVPATGAGRRSDGMGGYVAVLVVI